jgi:Arc/MetJ-type ribon-helix-helix transcriptional regulator
MTKQIAVRLPVDLVAFVDEIVADGDAASRAVVVTRALERERRRRVAARDAAILAAADDDHDLQALSEHVARQPLDLG